MATAVLVGALSVSEGGLGGPGTAQLAWASHAQDADGRFVSLPSTAGAAQTQYQYLQAGAPRALFSGEGVLLLLGGGARIAFAGSERVVPRLEGIDLAYVGLYPGADLHFRPAGAGVKYEWHLAPGADLSTIRMEYDEATNIALEPGGAIVVSGPGWSFRDGAPLSFDAEGAAVDCAFAPSGAHAVGFACDGWDATRALTIDPLLYGTYFGGSQYEYVTAVAQDAAGNTYILGYTNSTDFPVPNGAYTTNNGQWDIFILKLSPTWRVLYGTYLGGSGNETPIAMAVDPQGRVFLYGQTRSLDFPVTPDAIDSIHAAPIWDNFLAIFEANGTLGYATYLLGTPWEGTRSIAAGEAGFVYLGGASNLSYFTPVAGTPANASGTVDATVLKIDASTRSVVYAARLGGSGVESAAALAVDLWGDAVVTGQTTSANFPTTPDAPYRNYNVTNEMFVARLSADGTALLNATFFGGARPEGVDIDASGAAAVAGVTDNSQWFPTTSGAFQDQPSIADTDLFVARFPFNGTGAAFSTYLQASGGAHVYEVLVTDGGEIFLSGVAGEHLTATPGAWEVMATGSGLYFAKFNATGMLLYCTYFGTTRGEMGAGITVKPSGDVNIFGATSSQNFPLTDDAFDRVLEPFGWDGFIVTLDIRIHRFELNTDPPGMNLQIDTFNTTTPYAYGCAQNDTYLLHAFTPHDFGTSRLVFVNWSDGATSDHVVRCDHDIVLTATYAWEYLVTLESEPPGANVLVNNFTTTTPATFWWRSDAPRFLEVPPVLPWWDGSLDRRWVFANWSDGGARAHSALPQGPGPLTARYAEEILVTLDTDPAELAIVLNGTTIYGHNQFWWRSRSEQTASVADMIGLAADDRLVFAGWSDGAPRDRTILLRDPVTLVASYTEEFAVAITSDPAGVPLVVDGATYASEYSGWWAFGAGHNVSAPAVMELGGARYTFSLWDDGGPRNHTAAASAPLAIRALFSTEYLVTVDTVPGNHTVVVDGSPRVGAASFWWSEGTVHRVTATAPFQVIPETRYRQPTWSDGGAADHSVTAAGPMHLTATFVREHLVTLTSAFGNASCYVPTCWYAEGDTATVRVQDEIYEGNATRHLFAAWNGSVSAMSSTVLLLVDGPKELTAEWRTQFLVTVTTPYGAGSGGGWYDLGAQAHVAVSPDALLVSGTRYEFKRWEETGSATPDLNLTVAGPLSLTAEWQAVPPSASSEPNLLVFGVGLAVAAIALVGIARLARKRRE